MENIINLDQGILIISSDDLIESNIKIEIDLTIAETNINSLILELNQLIHKYSI